MMIISTTWAQSVNGQVLGVTPVALTTKSQPYTCPLVSSTYTGQSQQSVAQQSINQSRK